MKNKKILKEALVEDLQKEFPVMTGFSARNICYMQQFYAEYHADKILQPLVAEISWSKHLVTRFLRTDNMNYLDV